VIAPASGWPTGYVDSSDTPWSVDPFTHVGRRDILVPLATWYRPLSMAAGIVGLYLMLAVWVSTQLRPRISYTWRLLHTLTFAVDLLSLLHALGTGTDTRQPWALALYAGSVLLVGALLLTRLLTPIGPRGRAPAPGGPHGRGPGRGHCLGRDRPGTRGVERHGQPRALGDRDGHRNVILASQCGHGHLVRWRWSDEW
jgi:hypothetical protein